ncbi:MAG: glycine--tRNA ligase subunit beta [Deltaproteobacteria bacterium]|jgi:glycyl-tRNA synthetase beta chain|nr:glycine--tRNA ligase subunit beta [Deltaproteobacteria bacterium]
MTEPTVPGTSGGADRIGEDGVKAVDYILELGVEEIPAGYFGQAVEYIRERLERELRGARLPFGRMEIWGGPRRLAVGIWGLRSMQPDVSEEVTGPPLSSAFDANGNPTKAAAGFAKGQGVPVSEIYTLQTPKGPYLAVTRKLTGRPCGEILAQIVPALLGSLPFPKSMRWGAGEFSFVRPVHWLLSVLDGEVLGMEFAGAKAGRVSYGHRFLSPGAVVIAGPGEYAARLAEAHVLAGFEERRRAVLDEIKKATGGLASDLAADLDPELVDEVANLVEEPAAVMGGFDSQFLDLPLVVSATAMKEHQRYFPVLDNQGRQAPSFVAVNNTRARDMDTVRRGHERVLRARLEDARFYYLDDRKTSLASRAEGLDSVVFHRKLGSYARKVERVTRLAVEIAQECAPEARDTAARAAALCKCDLLTGVVKEFPSLQGVMGREYALADGEPREVADAIAEHYLPVRSGGELPATSAGAVLAVADKIDTVCGCFFVNEAPTGAADPFALRRQALGAIQIVLDRGWRMSFEPYVDRALASFGAPDKGRSAKEIRTQILDFLNTRLKTHILAQGVSADGAEAVLSLHGTFPLASVQRAVALEALKRREGFRDLAQTFKRVVNIIRKFGGREIPLSPGSLTQDAERRLLEAVSALDSESGRYLADGDFAGLLERIASLKAPVDAFFEGVLVDDPDPDLKTARVALLNQTASLFELVADFSRISTA